MQLGGSVGYTFIQTGKFSITQDIAILEPKNNLSDDILLFMAIMIKEAAKGYSFDRKWGISLIREASILLPVKDGIPDYEFIEKFMQNI